MGHIVRKRVMGVCYHVGFKPHAQLQRVDVLRTFGWSIGT